MRLYVIPLLAHELMKAEAEIKLYQSRLSVLGEDKKETSQYFRDQRDKWQAIKQEILESINKLEAI